MHNYDDRRARRTCDHHSDETLLQSELRTFGKPFGNIWEILKVKPFHENLRIISNNYLHKFQKSTEETSDMKKIKVRKKIWK